MKIKKIGQSAAKPRIEEGSTTIETTYYCMEGVEYTQVSGSARHLGIDEDIVYSIWKHIAALVESDIEVTNLYE